MGRTLFMRRCRGRVAGLWVFLLLLLLLYVIYYLIIHHPRHPPRDIRHIAQFNVLATALELFKNDFGAYPPSDANDATGGPYAGAMRLAEALMGQDKLGFHSASAFRADGLDPNADLPLYPSGTPSAENLKTRRGPFVQAENANAFRLADIYGKGNTGPFSERTLVLCDTFVRKRPGGSKTGMPILYYKANRSGTAHDANNPDNPQNIYDYRDNQALISFGVAGEPNGVHPLADPKRFYLNIQSDRVLAPQPYRRDSYILISAGSDGLYGTADDICNFQWRYRER